MPELRWVTDPDEDERAGLTALVQAVAATGGAVGWLAVPSRAEVDAWVDDVLSAGGRLLTAYDGSGALVGAGLWTRHTYAVTRQNAELRKLMVSPAARGDGVGRAVAAALVEDAARAGVEVLSLDCRGNNHGALALYGSLGFVVSGRRPDWIAVGDGRFDQVLLHLDLRVRTRADPALLRHGGRREGPGAT